jgi:hypothetical protein
MTARKLGARLRELTGFEEEWLRWGEGARRSVPAACHELLARCLALPGAAQPADLETVRDLRLDERDWLILELRCLSFGPRIRSEVRCPACEQPALVDFSARELPVRPPDHAPERLRVELSGGRVVELRPLTAGDHELFWVSQGLGREEQRALALSQVVLSMETEVGELLPEDLDSIEEALEAAAPEAMRAELHCGHCGQPLTARFDPAAFFVAELKEHARTLLDDVHTLAQSYHWSQGEIFGLSLRRRLEYLTRIEAGRDASLLRVEERVR